MTKEYYAQHRIGNSGADSNKLNICNSIGHLCKSWADVLQMPHHRQYVTVVSADENCQIFVSNSLSVIYID